MDSSAEIGRLSVVSNRLPIALMKKDGIWAMEPGSGGLVTAMSPVLRYRDGIWIGWMGTTIEDLPERHAVNDFILKGAEQTGYLLKEVALSREEVEKYYFGFSNEVLWPLFHDLFSQCNFDPEFWEIYGRVNAKFARAITDHTRDTDFVWIHDYQLLLVGKELKKAGFRRRSGFFLHIPFPPLDIYLKMPWRFQILESMLEYDLLGFQTVRDKKNFIGCVRALLGYKVFQKGPINAIFHDGREVLIGSFPISIDFSEFEELARTKEVEEKAWFIHEEFPDCQLILGIDRLDYTKGIPHRLMAFEHALSRFPELRRKVTLIQVVVPSRSDVEDYKRLKNEIERIVGEINGRFTEVGWMPVHYIYRSLTRSELIAYYRTCEIALITPLKDGMNLVCKEYCASNIDEKGVLILSEFAGAASQFYQSALLVNPYDRQGVADAIYKAFSMSPEERQARMKRLRRAILKYDIYNWVNTFLMAAIGKNLDDFQPQELFVPRQ